MDITDGQSELSARRPSTVRYQTLVDALAAADHQVLQEDGHPLVASIQALQAVVQFIRDDPKLGPTDLGTVLRRLLGDLCDVANGARSGMLFNGAVNQPGKAGRRTGLTVDTVRGFIVFAVHSLIEAGMKNEAAARYMADQLRQAGVRHKGKVIEAKRILQWREQRCDTAPKAADEALAWAMGLTAEFLADGGLERAIDVAKQAVKIARLWNSR
jgi:hypothetical protein